MIKVFTNGCFDILHVGHMRLLEFAKSCGDYLVVGLNSDRSIKSIKGDDRPIIHQEERKEMLQAIRWVDDVVVFHEPNPLSLIKKIQPYILVKGADWKDKKVIGSHLVKEVKFFPHQGHSTTDIIGRIKL
jgi:D-beta-D-heptose 7-phosphate kinase/D-beta-D-heptose 1-phosphate adenosyltransferase